LNICSELKKVFPAHKVLLLSELDYTWLHRLFRPSLNTLIASALDNNLDGIDIWAGNMIDKNLVSKCHMNSLMVYTWTVNSPGKALELVNLGVEGITTDRTLWLKENINYST
jgi:glycerophosphoryl diester phosphodiesterase